MIENKLPVAQDVASHLYKKGVVDEWHAMTFAKPVGICGCGKGKTVAIPAGELRVVLSFFGEEGVKYPASVGESIPSRRPS